MRRGRSSPGKQSMTITDCTPMEMRNSSFYTMKGAAHLVVKYEGEPEMLQSDTLKPQCQKTHALIPMALHSHSLIPIAIPGECRRKTEMRCDVLPSPVFANSNFQTVLPDLEFDDIGTD